MPKMTFNSLSGRFDLVSQASDFASDFLKLDQTTPQTIINGQPIQNTLTASKLVFTDSVKKLTSIGIGTSYQFIKADGSVDGSTYLTSTQLLDIIHSTSTITSSSTPTPNMDLYYEYCISALATDATFGIPIGTLYNGNLLIIRVKDNNTPRVLSWNPIYQSIDNTVSLPTTTIVGRTIYSIFAYNSTTLKWELLSVVGNN